MAWLGGWTYRKKITIDHTKIDSGLTDFPVLVKLTSANFNFSKARSDGYDIRFTSSDGTTLLKYERERHDSTNQVAEYWVKIPSVSSTADTIFYIYYGKSDASDGADPTNVWDANYKAVHHLKDLTTSSVDDSTASNNDGTKTEANEPIEIDGIIAKAQDFDGVNDKITFGQLTNGYTALTAEIWARFPSLSGNKYFVAKGNGDTIAESTWVIYTVNNTNVKADIYYGSSDVYTASWAGTLNTNTWYYMALTWDGSTLKVYLNNNVGSQTASVSAMNAVDSPMVLGSSGGTAFYDLDADELRISNIGRSAAWIKASYYSEANSLLSLGSEEIGWIPRVIIF